MEMGVVTMDSIASRIRHALEINEMRQVDLVKKAGISKASLSTYIKGVYEPKQKNIHKIAKALNVSEEWLMGYDVPMERSSKPQHTKLNKTEKEVIEMYRDLPDEDKQTIVNLITSLSMRNKKAQN